MLDALRLILKIQELDIKMIRLMRLKKERKKERDHLWSIEEGLQNQQHSKELEITEIKKLLKLGEAEVVEVQEKISKLENQQHSVKKVEEFNALSHEMASAEKEKALREQRLSDLYDRLAIEEDAMKALNETLKATHSNSQGLQKEIHDVITQINDEGAGLLEEREHLAHDADPEVLKVYERLLNNKKDRVVVPIENRACSGCHILVTAQDENLVRKGERLVFCEHCSRIQFWPDHAPEVEEEGKATKRRRRSPARV